MAIYQVLLVSLSIRVYLPTLNVFLQEVASKNTEVVDLLDHQQRRIPNGKEITSIYSKSISWK